MRIGYRHFGRLASAVLLLSALVAGAARAQLVIDRIVPSAYELLFFLQAESGYSEVYSRQLGERLDITVLLDRRQVDGALTLEAVNGNGEVALAILVVTQPPAGAAKGDLVSGSLEPVIEGLIKLLSEVSPECIVAIWIQREDGLAALYSGWSRARTAVERLRSWVPSIFDRLEKASGVYDGIHTVLEQIEFYDRALPSRRELLVITSRPRAKGQPTSSQVEAVESLARETNTAIHAFLDATIPTDSRPRLDRIVSVTQGAEAVIPLDDPGSVDRELGTFSQRLRSSHVMRFEPSVQAKWHGEVTIEIHEWSTYHGSLQVDGLHLEGLDVQASSKSTASTSRTVSIDPNPVVATITLLVIAFILWILFASRLFRSLIVNREWGAFTERAGLMRQKKDGPGAVAAGEIQGLSVEVSHTCTRTTLGRFFFSVAAEIPGLTLLRRRFSADRSVEIRLGDERFDRGVRVIGNEGLARALLDEQMRARVYDVVQMPATLSESCWRHLCSGKQTREQLEQRLWRLCDVAIEARRKMRFVPRALCRQVVEDPSADVRLASLDYLTTYHPGEPELPATLATAAQDVDPRVRLRVAIWLKDDARLVKFTLDHELPPDVRARALHHVWKNATRDDTVAVLNDLAMEFRSRLDPPLVSVWIEVVQALEHPTAQPTLLQLTRSPNRSLRLAALETLGLVANVEVVSVLTELRESREVGDETREAAKLAILAIQSRIPGHLGGALSLAKTDGGLALVEPASE